MTRAAGSGAPGHCQDARAARYESLDFNGDAPGIAIARLAATSKTVSYGADLLSTRCAGPLESDIAAVLPTRSLPVQALRTGSTTIDLSATRAFAAAGMAGTVRSSIVLRSAAPRRSTSTHSERFPGSSRACSSRSGSASSSLPTRSNAWPAIW